MPLTYPTPAQYLYKLLRLTTGEALEARFHGWRFSATEAQSLLDLQTLARQHDFPYFVEQLHGLVERHPERYPAVLRPRRPALDLGARRFRYGELLRGKRVALVGPSQSVVGSRQGYELEAYDLVVRINFQWPVPTGLVADIGERMDVLYHCCNADVPIERLFQRGFERTRFVCWQFGIDSPRLQDYCASVNVPDLEVSSVFDELLQRMHAFPTTGTAALYDLLSHDLDRLYVTGLTFFRDPHYEGYPTGSSQAGREYRHGQVEAVGIHDVSAQFELVRWLRAKDRRLIVDSTLRDLLDLP